MIPIIIGIQQQASANCLNDANMVRDSDGTAIAPTPFNAAPNQAIELELEFGDDNGAPRQYSTTRVNGFISLVHPPATIFLHHFIE